MPAEGAYIPLGDYTIGYMYRRVELGDRMRRDSGREQEMPEYSYVIVQQASFVTYCIMKMDMI